jgi:phage terminase small subunit
MPILENGRWELFAQALAKGETATKAYENAGYRGSRSNAARLRANEHIAARVLEIQAAGAKSAEISVASLIEELEAARVKATSLNQLSAAVRATAEKAKISGLLINRSQVDVDVAVDDFDQLKSTAEILDKVRRDLGERAAAALAYAFELTEGPEEIVPPPAVKPQALEWQPPKKSKR